MYSRNRRSGDHANRTRILEQVTDIFKNQIDADVIKLILDQNDWKVEETIEQLFQLASSATPTASSREHNINLDIIACSLLDDSDYGAVAGSSASSLPVNAGSNINPEALSLVNPEASSFNSATFTSPLMSVLSSAVNLEGLDSVASNDACTCVTTPPPVHTSLEGEGETLHHDSATPPPVHTSLEGEGETLHHDSAINLLKGAENIIPGSVSGLVETADSQFYKIPVTWNDVVEDYDIVEDCDESDLEPGVPSVNDSSVNSDRTPTSSISVSISKPAEASHNNTSVISSTSSFVVSSSVVEAASKDLLLLDTANNVEYSSSAATSALLFSGISSSKYSTFFALDRESGYKTDAKNSLLTGDFDPFALQAAEEVYAELYAELLNSSLAETSTSTKDSDVTYTHFSSDEPFVIHSKHAPFCADGLLNVKSEYVTKSSSLEEHTSVELNSSPTGDTNTVSCSSKTKDGCSVVKEDHTCCTDSDTNSGGSGISSDGSSVVPDKHIPLISSPQIDTDLAGNVHMDKKPEFSSSVNISSSCELAKETSTTGRVDSIASSNSSSEEKSMVSTASSLPTQSASNIARSSTQQEKTSVPKTQSAPRQIPGSDHSEVCGVSSGHPLAAGMGLSPEAPEFVPKYFVPSLVPQPGPQFVTPTTSLGMKNSAPFSHRQSSANKRYSGLYPARFNMLRPLKPIRGVSLPVTSASPQPSPQPLKLIQGVPLPHVDCLPQSDMHAGYLPRSKSRELTGAPVSKRLVENLIGANLYHASSASDNVRRPHVLPSGRISKNVQEDASASKLSPHSWNACQSSKYASENGNGSTQLHGQAHDGKLPSKKSWSAMAQEPPQNGASLNKENWSRQAQEPKGGSLSSSRNWPSMIQEQRGGSTCSVGSGNLQGVGNGVKMVQSYTRSGAKLLVLLRGLPGSGKSYLASAIKGSGEVFTTDDYFMRNGVYEFDPNLLTDAHTWNKQRVRGALDQGVSPVIVDNTNVMMWEMLPYAQMADERGYAVEVLEPETHWKCKPKHLSKRNSHGVSIESIKRMKDRFQSVDTASLRAHLNKLKSVPIQAQDKQERTDSTPSPSPRLPEKTSLNYQSPVRGVPAHTEDTHDVNVNLDWEKPKSRRQKKTSKDTSHPSRNEYRVLENEKPEGVNLTFEVRVSARSKKQTNDTGSGHLELQHVPANGKTQGSEAEPAWEAPASSRAEKQQEDGSTLCVAQPAIDEMQVEEVDLTWEEPKPARKRERRLRSRESGSDAVDSEYTEEMAEEEKSSLLSSESFNSLVQVTTNTVENANGCMPVDVKQEEAPASPRSTSSNGDKVGDDDSSALDSETEMGTMHSSSPHISNSGSDSGSCTRNTVHLGLQAFSTTHRTAVKEDRATRDLKQEYVAAFNNSSLALISTMYASSDDEFLIPCTSLMDNNASQKTESDDSRSMASPDRQSHSSSDNFGDTTQSGSSFCNISAAQDLPLLPRKKVRTKKHKIKHAPFFDERFKAQMRDIDWRTYNPATLLPGAQPSTSLTSSTTVSTEMLLMRPDSREASSQTDVQGFNLMFMETNSILGTNVSMQEGYRCVTARGIYMTTDADASHSNIIGGSMHTRPSMRLDKSTEIDLQLVKVMPDIEILQNCFPEVAVSHLEEVLEICSGNMDWATNLLLDWSVSTPLTAIDREQLREEMALHPEIFAPPLVPTPSSASHIIQPQSLFDLCRKQLELTQGKELSDDIQMQIIQNSYKRLQSMEKLELLRARSMSYDENFPEGVGISDNIMSLTVFTTASVNPPVQAATCAVHSTIGSMHKGVKTQGVNKLMAAARPSHSLKGIAEEIFSSTSGESTPTYSSGSSLESSRSSSFSNLSNTAREHGTDETLDYAAASLLQACEEAEREERKRQIEEENYNSYEALARWMESEQESDHILEGVTAISTTTTNTTTTKQHSKRNVAVGGLTIQDLSKKIKIPKQRKVHPSPIVSLRNIMAEEEEQQKHREAKLRELEASGAIATKLKRQKLSQHFPGVPEEFLEGVFADSGYCFETTVSLLESSLGGKQAISHKMVLEQSAAFEEAEEQLVDKAKTRSLLDVSNTVWHVQPVSGLGELEVIYNELRQEAAVHSIMRKECFFKCQAAHRRKMQGVGDFYSQQGRHHMNNMQLANQQASQMLLSAREQQWRGQSTLDLHGFFTEEALSALRIVINEKVTEQSTKPDRGYLKVITGRGKNSQNKVAKIRPAVLKFLSGNGYRYTEVNEGMLKVWL